MSNALKSLEPVGRSETLGRRVQDQLRAAIMAGRFSPGEKLTIRAVASALDVSLTPAREALYNLAATGALDMRSNGSVYIHELTKDRIDELTCIRVELEGLAAREAAKRISDKNISDAEKINDQLIKAHNKHDYHALIDLNWQFHFLIYQECQMPMLLSMIESCWLMTGSYLNVIYPDFGKIDHGLDNHAAILDALKARKSKALSKAICIDIQFAASALTSAIESNR